MDEEAKEYAERAGEQGKHAVKNSGRAVRAVAEPMVEGAAEEIREAGDRIEDTAHDAFRAARRVNVGVLGRMSSDTGIGFLALSVAIYSGAISYAKFRQALAGRGRITYRG